MNCSRLSVQVILSEERAPPTSSFLVHKIDHLSPSTIFYSLIESRSSVSSEIAAEESAVNDSLELWECVPALA